MSVPSEQCGIKPAVIQPSSSGVQQYPHNQLKLSGPTSAPEPQTRSSHARDHRVSRDSLSILDPKDLPVANADESTGAWNRFRCRYHEALSEFLATLVFICVGQAASLQSQFDPDGSKNLDFFSYGLGVMISVYIAGGVSGAHLNPCISLALAIFRGFPVDRLPEYMLAQFLGAIAGSSLAYAVYSSHAPTGLELITTLTTTSYACAFFNDLLAASILMMAVLAISDESNNPPAAGASPLIVAFIITVLGFAFGYSTGMSINPVRDIGPRVVAACVSRSTEAFTRDYFWFLWGGTIAPVLGCLLGALIYDLLILNGSISPVDRHSGKQALVTDAAV